MNKQAANNARKSRNIVKQQTEQTEQTEREQTQRDADEIDAMEAERLTLESNQTEQTANASDDAEYERKSAEFNEQEKELSERQENGEIVTNTDKINALVNSDLESVKQSEKTFEEQLAEIRAKREEIAKFRAETLAMRNAQIEEMKKQRALQRELEALKAEQEELEKLSASEIDLEDDESSEKVGIKGSDHKMSAKMQDELFIKSLIACGNSVDRIGILREYWKSHCAEFRAIAKEKQQKAIMRRTLNRLLIAGIVSKDGTKLSIVKKD